ncbi:MAG TPA: diguanylate cyclase [Bryobacteraceae bacterium]|nr:diguanylate cyclase [Bryobacteraceae bacterium]
MISLRTSLTELEQAHQFKTLALECYRDAIQNAAHYAIELDDQITAPHRQYLNALARELTHAGIEEITSSRATLRGLLRDYRDKSAQYINELRQELGNTAHALQEIMDSLSQADGDHESRLRTTLKRIREVASQPEGNRVGPVLLDAAKSIEDSLEEIRKQHQFTISQFLEEVRMLHKRIDSMEAAAAVDRLTDLLNRGETEERIKSAAKGGACLLLLKVRGFRLAATQFDQSVASELAAAFIKRLRGSLPPVTIIGRWSEEEFVAMLTPGKTESMAIAKWIGRHLSGAYVCILNGKAVRPTIQVTVGLADSHPSDSPERTTERIREFFAA